jgi:hypothetical protein
MGLENKRLGEVFGLMTEAVSSRRAMPLGFKSFFFFKISSDI